MRIYFNPMIEKKSIGLFTYVSSNMFSWSLNIGFHKNTDHIYRKLLTMKSDSSEIRKRFLTLEIGVAIHNPTTL